MSHGRVAVFVDAGYLYAQGSYLLTGAPCPRRQLSITDCTALFGSLAQFAESVSQGRQLLRVYWFDGLLSGRRTADQLRIEECANVKVRYGLVNSQKQQKEVDTMIVTDLVDLARSHSICDAVLISGDGDIRIGVAIAQGFGVRVHLLAIGPVGSNSMSPDLFRECDTRHDWDKDSVASFLKVENDSAEVASPPSLQMGTNGSHISVKTDEISEFAAQAAADVAPADRAAFPSYRQRATGLPPEIDRPMLGKARKHFGRDLSSTEKVALRAAMVKALGQ